MCGQAGRAPGGQGSTGQEGRGGELQSCSAVQAHSGGQAGRSKEGLTWLGRIYSAEAQEVQSRTPSGQEVLEGVGLGAFRRLRFGN